jgi:peptide/nickel transport system substrate-binding protein
MAQKHTRRDFIRLTGLATAGVIVAACAQEPEVVEKVVKETVVVEKEVAKAVTVVVEKEVVKEATAAPEAPTAVPSKYQESPMLAERVARGELPPVDERLPEEPRVCEVLDQIGEYGGALTVASLASNLLGDDGFRCQDVPNQLCISHDLTHAIPHMLKDWEQSDDFTEVTCYMRKGMKWSDGHPFTTADVRFWWEEVMLNTEITPLLSAQFRPQGEPMEMEIIDDYTFKYIFKVPYPCFPLLCMSHRYGFGHNHFLPAHYLEQFHINYNEDAGELANEAGFDFWYQLFGREADRFQSIDRPKMEEFIPVRDTPQMAFHERNPYYHAVDPEGNQLPYIDRMYMDRCADLSILDAKTVGGTYEFAAQQLRILFYATYADGAAENNSRMLLWQSGKGGEVVYNVNMNWPDDEWREVFSDDRFRQALSLAINRPDINNVIYFGNAAETQMTVIPVSRHFRPEFAQAYVEFDLDQANALLDDMGLEWNAAETHRLWPVSKEPMIIAWDLVETETPKGPITELVTEYWKAIGIEIQWKSVTRTLLSQKVLANEEPMSLWHGDETADTLFLRRSYSFLPYEGDESTWGILWGRWWNTGGEQGEEPPEMIKQLFEWQEEYNITGSDEPARKVLESQAEHIWTIGTVGMAPHPLFVRNNLRNVTETGGFWTWDSLWAYPEFPEQWFFKS